MTKRSKDIDPFILRCDESADDGDHAAVVFHALCAVHVSAVNWYLAEKRRKAIVAKFLRVLSVLALSVGALMPLVASSDEAVSPYLGYFFLAIAAGLQLADRQLGFSNAWSRCVEAAMEINCNLLVLQVSWRKEQFVDAQTHWDILDKHTAHFCRIVTSETSGWVKGSAELVNELEVRIDGGKGVSG